MCTPRTWSETFSSRVFRGPTVSTRAPRRPASSTVATVAGVDPDAEIATTTSIAPTHAGSLVSAEHRNPGCGAGEDGEQSRDEARRPGAVRTTDRGRPSAHQPVEVGLRRQSQRAPDLRSAGGNRAQHVTGVCDGQRLDIVEARLVQVEDHGCGQAAETPMPFGPGSASSTRRIGMPSRIG